MGATLLKIAGIGVLIMAFGCRTPQPNLKPATTAEALNTPPSERRFDTAVYPKEAFNDRDRKLNVDQDILPVKGPSMPGSSTTGGLR